MLKLGLLDFGFFDAPRLHSYEVLDNLFEVAPKADELGFSRYWLAEHYEHGVGWRNPDHLVGLLCGSTEQIKVGPAGVLLLLHSPLAVVQRYKQLAYLFDGRIDLGLARGVSEQHVAKALWQQDEVDFSRDRYAQMMQELFHFFRGTFPEDHPSKSITVPPHTHVEPEVWTLGTGRGSIPFALEYNTAFSLSLFHKTANANGGGRPEYLHELQDRYREQFGVEARCNICIGGLCAPSYEEAQRRLKLHVQAHASIEQNVVGTPESCREQLLELQDKYRVDEIIFCDLNVRLEHRLEGLQMLAETMQMVVV